MSSQPTTAKGVVIAVINQKGGAGKSSTAIHLADWLRTKQKQQVLLIDSDPQRFGKTGSYYYQVARAEDDRSVNPHRIRKSIGAEQSFAEDLETGIKRLG